jgi:hypothetical protein
MTLEQLVNWENTAAIQRPIVERKQGSSQNQASLP